MNCEHDYVVLEKDITAEQTTFDGEPDDISIKGYVIFYCRKCTELKKEVLNNA